MYSEYSKKVKLQTRTLSTGASSNVFQLLKIDVLNILKNRKGNLYLQNSINQINELDNELKVILEDDTTDLNFKETQLEKYSRVNQSFQIELKYNVPRELSQLITRIDAYLFKNKNLDTSDVSPYLSSALAKNLGSHPGLKRCNKTKEVTNTLTIFKDFLKIFKKMDNSIGLFLIYNLVDLLRSDFSNNKLKKIAETQQLNRKLFFGAFFHSDSDNVVDEVVLNIKRIEITSKLGQNLVECFTHLKNAYILSIEKKEKANIPDFEDLSEEDQTIALLRLLEIKSPENYELFKMLNDRYLNNTAFSEIEIALLGIQCVNILEAANILVDSGSRHFDMKSVSIVSISKEYANAIFSIPVSPKNLPMLVKPNYWEKSKKSVYGNLNYGGYLFNKTLNYPAILNQQKKGVTKIIETDLININFIQSNFYNVNQEFLKYVTSNFKTIVRLYLREIPNVAYFIHDLDRDNIGSIQIKSMEELFRDDDELSTLVQNLQMQPTNKTLKVRIAKRKAYLTSNYQDIANVFFKLVNTYVIASNFQKFKFYFTVFLDARGRLYFKSVGSAFGLQAGDFSKALIDLSGNDYYDTPTINKVNYSPDNKNYLDYIATLDEKRNPFSTIRSRLGILPTTISNDAACSGSSIISGFCGYLTGLYLTNIFSHPKYLDEKLCIYSYFLIAMNENFPKNAYSLYSEDKIQKKAKSLNISPETFVSQIDFNLFSIKNELLKREHAKQIVMRKTYSETSKGRGEYIYNEVFQTCLSLTNAKPNRIEVSINKSFTYHLAEWLDNLYKEEFSEIAPFCEYLTSAFVSQKRALIKLICSNQSEFHYRQIHYDTVIISRPTFEKSRKAVLSYYIPTELTDFTKIQRSLFANLVQYLDSRLNILVIDKCRKAGLSIWTNHDCFYICPTQKHKILKFYFEAYVDLLLKEDVIECFLEHNNVTIDSKLKKYLKKHKNNRQVILKKLHDKELKMSLFILSS